MTDRATGSDPCAIMDSVSQKQWRLDPADVSVARDWHRRGGRSGRISRTSRAATTQTGRVVLTHRPTGISVEGSTPEVQLTRKKMTALMNTLIAELTVELETKIAQQYRLPGR